MGPIDQDAIKLEFFRKVHRKNPPFRIKVKLAPKKRAKVPLMVKQHYRSPIELLPSLRDVLRLQTVKNRYLNFDLKEPKVKCEIDSGASCNDEESGKSLSNGNDDCHLEEREVELLELDDEDEEREVKNGNEKNFRKSKVNKTSVKIKESCFGKAEESSLVKTNKNFSSTLKKNFFVRTKENFLGKANENFLDLRSKSSLGVIKEIILKEKEKHKEDKNQIESLNEDNFCQEEMSQDDESEEKFDLENFGVEKSDYGKHEDVKCESIKSEGAKFNDYKSVSGNSTEEKMEDEKYKSGGCKDEKYKSERCKDEQYLLHENYKDAVKSENFEENITNEEKSKILNIFDINGEAEEFLNNALNENKRATVLNQKFHLKDTEKYISVEVKSDSEYKLIKEEIEVEYNKRDFVSEIKTEDDFSCQNGALNGSYGEPKELNSFSEINGE